MKGIRVSLITVFLLSFLVGHLLWPEKKVDESLYLGEVAPDIKFQGKKGIYYPSPEGITAFNTYDITPSIRGYAGPIKVLLALSPDGKIYGIRILKHKETPNYVHRMESPEFLRQFLGKDINDPFEVERDIDGISRATVSVEAMAKTIRESSRKVASEVMGIEVIGKEEARPSSFKWIIYLGLFLSAFAGYLITRQRKSLLRLRDISLIVSIPAIGFYLSSSFSILHIFNLLLRGPAHDMLWLIVVISTVMSVLIAGRFYCGWLCPFGAISEFIGRLPLRKWKLPYESDDRWRNVKYVLLGLIISVVFVTKRVEFACFETYVALFSLHGNALMWLLVVLSLALSLRVERFWCRYLCPVSALTGVLSRGEKGYISTHNCPMANKPHPLISECIRCNRCRSQS